MSSSNPSDKKRKREDKLVELPTSRNLKRGRRKREPSREPSPDLESPDVVLCWCADYVQYCKENNINPPVVPEDEDEYCLECGILLDDVTGGWVCCTSHPYFQKRGQRFCDPCRHEIQWEPPY